MDVETLVVDNGSVDGSLAYLESEGVPHVSLPRNVGFAAAVNLGASRVSASSILALNADTALEPGALGSLLEAMESDLSLGGVQPRILQLEEGKRMTPDNARPLQRRAGAYPRRPRRRGGSRQRANVGASTWP